MPADLDLKVVNRIFGVIFATNFITCMDFGFLPAATITLQEELKITTAQLGALGSCAYIGQAVGSLIVSVFYRKYDEKTVMIAFLFLNGLSLLWFTLASSFLSLAFARAVAGIFQQVINIYYPVWADCFAEESKKSAWVSILLVGNTCGNIIGYIFMAFAQD